MLLGVVLISLWPLPLSAYLSFLRALGLIYAVPSLFCCKSNPGLAKLVLIYSFWDLGDVCVRCLCVSCGWVWVAGFGWVGKRGLVWAGAFGSVKVGGCVWVCGLLVVGVGIGEGNGMG